MKNCEKLFNSKTYVYIHIITLHFYATYTIIMDGHAVRTGSVVKYVDAHI